MGLSIRRIIAGTMLGVLAVSQTGCSVGADSAIVLKEKTVKINVGDEVSTELSDYVRASKTVREEMTLDVSHVDSQTIGNYTAKITYGKYSKNFTISVTDLAAPVICLKTNTFYLANGGMITLDDVVESVTDVSKTDYGFSDDLTLADDKKGMKDSISFSEAGTYTCEVIAKDAYQNYAVKEFTVQVVEDGETIPDDAVQVDDYSFYMNKNSKDTLGDLESYSSETLDYGVGSDKDAGGVRPDLEYFTTKFGGFAVDFIQPDSSYIWVTFNCQYEKGYTSQILDTLKEKNVSAVFFVTKNYMESNPDLIRRMIDEGHVLGNDTADGLPVGAMSANELTSEIELLYNYAYENYGYEMYLFRCPSGNFSEKNLAVAQSLGYRTVFWSFAYADWNADEQPEVSEALSNAVDSLHGGEIMALSAGSSTNAAMLGDLIDMARENGYEFAVYQKTE